MKYRIGAVHSVERYLKRKADNAFVFIVVGLVNRQGIENWLRIQVSLPESGVHVSLLFGW